MHQTGIKADHQKYQSKKDMSLYQCPELIYRSNYRIRSNRKADKIVKYQKISKQMEKSYKNTRKS